MTNSFGRLVDEASALFEGAGVQAYWWDPRSNLLVPAVGNAISNADGPAPRPLGVGAAGRAALTGGAVLIADYGESVGSATAAGRAGVLAAMGVPLFTHGQLIGAISVGVDHEHVLLSSQQLNILQALADGWSNDDQLAFLSGIYDVYRRAAVRIAYRLLRDRGLAEDAVQDVFLAVWRSGTMYDPERGSLRTWLLTMVHRRAIDVYRMRLRRPTCTVDDDEFEVQGGRDPIIHAQRAVDRAQIDLILEELPPEQRQALEFAYFAGLSHAEIASALQLPVGTIKGRIRLALDRLRRSPGCRLLAESTAGESGVAFAAPSAPMTTI